jgi:hypothetical protein
MSGIGPNAKWRHVRYSAAIGGVSGHGQATRLARREVRDVPFRAPIGPQADTIYPMMSEI